MNPNLYETDIVEWARENAALLRSGALAAAAIAHIAEEMEDLGTNWERALESRLMQLLLHLLKLQCQPQYPGTRGWKVTVLNQRIELERLLRKAPSLLPKLEQKVSEVYPDSRKLAVVETGLDPSVFPANCPWTTELVMDQGFLPGPADAGGQR